MIRFVLDKVGSAGLQGNSALYSNDRIFRVLFDERSILVRISRAAFDDILEGDGADPLTIFQNNWTTIETVLSNKISTSSEWMYSGFIEISGADLRKL
jgi:hypothetical protein